MDVVYSINERIGAPGIGTPAYYVCSALAEHKYLKQALALGYLQIGRTNFAAKVERAVPFGKLVSNVAFGIRKFIPQFPAYTLRDNLFDYCAARKLQPSTIFHGWNQHCLFTMRKAKEAGTITIVERGSTHIKFQQRILQQEYRKYHLQFPPIEPAVVRKCLKEFSESDYLLVNSEFSRQSFIAEGIAKEKLLCVPRGVDYEKFAGKRKRPEQFTLLFAGLISVRKGIPYILEAWKQLALPNAKLVLAGTLHPDAKAILAAYADDPSIEYRGFVADLRPEYRAASAFVLPTLEEGSAKVAFEAMAAGLPVITTPNSGSVVRHGKDGLIGPIRNVAALKQAIQRFARSETDCQQFGKRAQQHVRKCSWEAYKKNMIKIYKNL